MGELERRIYGCWGTRIRIPAHRRATFGDATLTGFSEVETAAPRPGEGFFGLTAAQQNYRFGEYAREEDNSRKASVCC
jgi:hypothetical protein